ncbi:MAG: MFS transporter [Fimbriimonadaceae bacterium]|nr:MFS transporter [Fimbriimonadaceae bacterium]
MTEAVDSAPWWKGLTKTMWLVLIVAWLGWVFDIFDSALFAFAKGPMLKELLSTPDAMARKDEIDGLMQLVFLIGWAIGGLIFGVMADRWGRARTMTLTILLYCLFTGLTGLCQTWEQVAVIRFLTALGIGGEWAAGAALIAETVPNKARAGAAALLQTAAAFGPWLASLANYALTSAWAAYELDQATFWRWLFVVGILPAFLTVVIRFKIKEPERWTEAQKQESKTSTLEPIKEMFVHPIWRRNVIVAMIIGAVGIAGAGNIAYWLPNLVEQVSKGLSPEDISARKSYATSIMHVGTFLGVLLVPWLCTKVGRRPTLFAFFILAPISVFVALNIGFSYTNLLVFGPLMAFLAIGLTATFGLYFPELFPTRFRATGSGFAYNVARIMQAPLPWLTGLLIAAGRGSPAHGVTLAAGVYLIGLLALPFAPETKGKELPEG